MSGQVELKDTLSKFQTRVNETPRVKKLVSRWTPTIVVHATDLEMSYSMPVANDSIVGVLDGIHEADHMVTLRGSAKDLVGIFSGVKNPARAFVDGELEVYGDDKDRVKLDAISLVLWGL